MRRTSDKREYEVLTNELEADTVNLKGASIQNHIFFSCKHVYFEIEYCSQLCIRKGEIFPSHATDLTQITSCRV